MSTIVTFDPSRKRRAALRRPTSRRPSGPAQVLVFTGVWRERLGAHNPGPGKAGDPVLEKPAPTRPGPKKSRSRKNG